MKGYLTSEEFAVKSIQIFYKSNSGSINFTTFQREHLTAQCLLITPLVKYSCVSHQRHFLHYLVFFGLPFNYWPGLASLSWKDQNPSWEGCRISRLQCSFLVLFNKTTIFGSWLFGNQIKQGCWSSYWFNGNVIFTPHNVTKMKLGLCVWLSLDILYGIDT